MAAAVCTKNSGLSNNISLKLILTNICDKLYETRSNSVTMITYTTDIFSSKLSATELCHILTNVMRELDENENRQCLTDVAKQAFNAIVLCASLEALSVSDIAVMLTTGMKALNCQHYSEGVYLYKFTSLVMKMITSFVRINKGPVVGENLTIITVLLNNLGSFVSGKSLTFPCDEDLFNWVLKMLSEPKFCSDLSTRGEVFKVVNRWPKHIFRKVENSRALFSAILVWSNECVKAKEATPVKNLDIITINYILVVKMIIKFDYFKNIFEQVVKQMDNFTVGPENRWFLNLLDLINDLMIQCNNNIGEFNSELSVLNKVEASLEFVCELFTNKYTENLWKSTTMCKYFSFVFVSHIGNILSICEYVNCKKTFKLINCANKVKYLIKYMNTKYPASSSCFTPSETTQICFNRMKKQYCSILNGTALDFGIDTLPTIKSLNEVPDNFLDDLTKDLMVCPVLMADMDLVVDKSTIIHAIYRQNRTEIESSKSKHLVKLDDLKLAIRDYVF